MVFSLKNHHFKKSIPPEGTFAPITRNSVVVMENKRSHKKTDEKSTKKTTKNARPRRPLRPTGKNDGKSMILKTFPKKKR